MEISSVPLDDILVFDVETSNFFTDPEVGWNNFEALKVSAIGVYSYAKDKYFCFDETEIEQAADLFRRSAKIIGFSINRYDVPVLNVAFRHLKEPLNLFFKDRVDLLDEIELVLGRRISLDLLSRANLGMGKCGTGSQATTLYKEGRIKELKEYCLKDVELTKLLYDQYRDKRYFLIPDRDTEENLRVEFSKQGEMFEASSSGKNL